MYLTIVKLLSLFFFLLFFFYNINYYKSDDFKSKLSNTRSYYKMFIENYGFKLKKIETNKNYKIFIDNSEYFKKSEKQPSFWELIR